MTWISGSFTEVDVYQRNALASDVQLEGPVIVEEYDSTTYVAPDWRARVEGDLLVMEWTKR